MNLTRYDGTRILTNFSYTRTTIAILLAAVSIFMFSLPVLASTIPTVEAIEATTEVAAEASEETTETTETTEPTCCILSETYIHYGHLSCCESVAGTGCCSSLCCIAPSYIAGNVIFQGLSETSYEFPIGNKPPVFILEPPK